MSNASQARTGSVRASQPENRCTGICLCKRFALSEARKSFTDRYRCTDYRDVLYVRNGGHVFVFEYGVIVFWGVAQEEEQRLCRELAPFGSDHHPEPWIDHFTFTLNSEQHRIHFDHIDIAGDQPLLLLAVSHGLAQSSKLTELESYAEETIRETAHIPKNLAETGSTRMPRREISRMRGRLFMVESDINLHYSLLDTPEFFWEYPELEELYLTTARYLDIQSRVEVLNRKLTVIHQLFDMLADEQKHKHSSLLEWIIIWLIAIEIVIFLYYDLL